MFEQTESVARIRRLQPDANLANRSLARQIRESRASVRRLLPLLFYTVDRAAEAAAFSAGGG